VLFGGGHSASASANVTAMMVVCVCVCVCVYVCARGEGGMAWLPEGVGDQMDALLIKPQGTKEWL